MLALRARLVGGNNHCLLMFPTTDSQIQNRSHMSSWQQSYREVTRLIRVGAHHGLTLDDNVSAMSLYSWLQHQLYQVETLI